MTLLEDSPRRTTAAARTGTAFWLAGVSAAARAPGFLIPVIVGAVFGAGPSTDAYFLAYGAVLLVGGTLGQSVEVSIVPFAAHALAQGEDRGFFDRKALKVALGAGGLWTLVVPVLLLLTGSLRGAVFGFALSFLPLAVMWGAAAVYGGGLVSQGRIAASTGSMLWRGAGGLAGFALAPAGGGLWAVAIGLGAGEAVRLVWVRRLLFSRTGLGGHGPDVVLASSFRGAAGSMVVAGITGTAVPMVEKLLAASLGAGAVSHLEYAVRLLMVPAVLFDGALAPLLLSRLSREQAVQGAAPSLRRAAAAVVTGGGVAVAVAAGLALLAPFIVTVVLAHGRFDAADVEVVSRILRWLSIGFAAAMTSLLVERIYLATARNRTIALLNAPRGGIRLLVVILLLPSQGLLAFPLGYAAGEVCYLGALILRAPR